MGISKVMKRYRIIVEAFTIIQEMQPIQTTEICTHIRNNTGYEISYGRLGQYLRPMVRDGQLLKVRMETGTYYITGKQAITAHRASVSHGN
jgi:predicted transcriptional regulator